MMDSCLTVTIRVALRKEFVISIPLKSLLFPTVALTQWSYPDEKIVSLHHCHASPNSKGLYFCPTCLSLSCSEAWNKVRGLALQRKLSRENARHGREKSLTATCTKGTLLQSMFPTVLVCQIGMLNKKIISRTWRHDVSALNNNKLPILSHMSQTTSEGTYHSFVLSAAVKQLNVKATMDVLACWI